MGLLIVHTGNGKGKTTAALGMLLRSLGHGQKCAVVQFIKGNLETSETKLVAVAEALGGQLEWTRCGEGFTWTMKDREQSIKLSEEGWAKAKGHLQDPELKFLLLDELNIALKHEFLDLDTVLRDLQSRHPHLNVVVTGRNAPQALMDAADLVTEMTEIKHPLKKGVKSQAGIEY